MSDFQGSSLGTRALGIILATRALVWPSGSNILILHLIVKAIAMSHATLALVFLFLSPANTKFQMRALIVIKTLCHQQRQSSRRHDARYHMFLNMI